MSKKIKRSHIVTRNQTCLYELNGDDLKFISLNLAVSLVKWSGDIATVGLEGVSVDMFKYLDDLPDGGSFRLLEFEPGLPLNNPKWGTPFLTFDDCKVQSKHIIRPRPKEYDATIITMRLMMSCRLTRHFQPKEVD